MPAKIRKRGDNTYQLTVSHGYDSQGKQTLHRKTIEVSGKSEEAKMRAAEKEYSLFVSEITRGLVGTSGKMTLHEYFDYWQKNFAEGRHAPKTIDRNKELFKRIDVALGTKRLDKLEAQHLLSFYANLAEPGIKIDPNAKRRKEPKPPTDATASLSANTIVKYHKLLHAIFEKAVQWQLIGYNVADRVEPPKFEKTVKPIYDEDTTGQFLLLLQEEELKYRVMALLSLASGMRRGELFALEWRHIDFDNNTISIEQSSQYLPGKGIFTKVPKSKNSKRVISVAESITSLLRQHKAEQSAKRLKLGGNKAQGGKWEGAEDPDNDRVFATWNGKPAHPDSFNNWLRKFIEKHNLPPISPHSFRHMAATYLITSGTDLRTVAGKLGHNPTTTQVVYSHLLKKAEQETANKMESFMQQAEAKAKEAQTKNKRAK